MIHDQQLRAIMRQAPVLIPSQQPFRHPIANAAAPCARTLGRCRLNPANDVAHLGHVELYTDRFDESLDFFVRVYGLTESARDEDSVYLRAFDDYEFHTLKLTRHHTTGVGHVAYRVSSPEALERRVAAIDASGCKVLGWTDGDPGHGPAFRFEDGFGHVFEIYWETRKFEAPEGERRH